MKINRLAEEHQRLTRRKNEQIRKEGDLKDQKRRLRKAGEAVEKEMEKKGKKKKSNQRKSRRGK